MGSAEIPASAVRSRSDLEAYLGQSLLAEYFDTSGRRPRQLATSLKTYLIELHADLVELESLGDGKPFSTIRVTDEENLWRADDASGESYFLDVSDPRFAFLHTIGHTNRTDAIWRKLVSGTPQADNCWIPSKMLESVRLGTVIGFRLFSQLQMAGLAISEEAEKLAQDLGRNQPPAFRLSVSDWATAERDLETFRENTSFGRRAALQSINWRQRAESKDSGVKFIHDEIWSTGKVTAYGTSWAAHLANLRALRSAYGRLVTGLEEEVALSWTEAGLVGEPVEIRFDELEVANLRELAEDIANGADPFRIMGYVDASRGDEFCSIDGIDLHTGGRLHIELSRELARLYLRQGTCGNVVPRFLVNFEHYLTATLTTTVDKRLVST